VNPYLFTSRDKVQTWDFSFVAQYRFTAATSGLSWAGRGMVVRHSNFESLASCLGPEGSCKPPTTQTRSLGGALNRALHDSASSQRRIRYQNQVPNNLPGGPLETELSQEDRPRDQVSFIIGFGPDGKQLLAFHFAS